MNELHRKVRYSALVIGSVITFIMLCKIFANVNLTLTLKALNWPAKSTKLNYMQSMFQLGAATSIAFAIAGPELQHALGPKVQEIIQHVNIKAGQPDAQVKKLEKTIKVLQIYDRQKRMSIRYVRSRLYPLHLSAVYINLSLLLWSSLIDPRGEILNGLASVIVILVIGFPLIDLRDVFVDARNTRLMLNKVVDACDSGMLTRIDDASSMIEAEIQSLSKRV